MEYKAGPQFTKEIKDRIVTGVFAVHGNVDDGNDRSWPGSFANFKMSGRNRVRFLWQHRDDPPIAVIKDIREIGRDELPAAVLTYAPEATGGVEVTREYMNNDFAEWVFEGISKEAINEMSYAYDVARSDFEEVDGKQIRNLREVKLYDISDVNWGMNPATAGVKSWSGAALTFVEHSEMVGTIVEEYSRRAKDRGEFRTKEGRVLSSATRARISTLLENLKTVSVDLDSLLKETEPKPASEGHSQGSPANAHRLFIEYQQTIAKLNGVINYAN